MKVGNILPRNYQSPLHIVYPFLKICAIFAITPPYIESKSKPSKGFKIYAIFVLIAFFSGYIYHVSGKLNDPVFQSIALTINLIDYFTLFILTVTNISIVLIVCLKRGDKLIALLRSLERLDSSVNLRVGASKRKFWTRLTIIQIAIISTLTADAATWICSLGMNLYKYYMPRNVQWYQFNLAFLLIFWLVEEIKHRLRRVNTLLWQSVRGYSKDSLFSTSIDILVKPYLIRVANYELLAKIKIWYADISKVVDELNSLFGIVLLSGVLFNITNVVYYTQLVMVYVVLHDDGTFGPFVVVSSLMWIAAALLQMMAIAAACDGLAKEAKRMPEICYILLNDVPSVPRTNFDAILKEELLLIADQSSTRRLCVSAAGFFDVDFGMMGFVVASITSYIIVTIQFVSEE